MPKKLFNSLLRKASQSIFIWKFPTVIDNPWKSLHSSTKGRRKQMTLGDQHGNFLKLLFSLIEKGVMTCDKKTYDGLVRLEKSHIITLLKYSPSKVIPKDDIEELKKQLARQIQIFRKLIENISVTDDPGKGMLIRLIGDVLADRGSNDFFTLLIINELKKKGVNFEILASNHDDAFFRSAAMKGMQHKNPLQVRSATNMQALIKYGIVEQEEINRLKKSYFQSIKLFSYSIESDENGNPSKLNIFNHAIAGPACLKSLIATHQNTVFTGIEYRDSTWEEICETIDAVNEKFMEYCLSKNIDEPWRAYEELLTTEDNSNPNYNSPHVSTPFVYLIWNRTKRNDDVWGKKDGIQISTIHGHIGDRSGYNDDEGINLDDNAGKWAQFENQPLSTPPIQIEGKNPIYVASCYTSLEVWRKERENQEYKELRALLNDFMTELKNCVALVALNSRDEQEQHDRFLAYENKRLDSLITDIVSILEKLPATIDENNYFDVQSKVEEIKTKLEEIGNITTALEKVRESDTKINRERTNEPSTEKQSQKFISLKSLRVNLNNLLSQLKSWIANLNFLWKQDKAERPISSSKKTTIQQKAEKFLAYDMAKLWGKNRNSNTDTKQEDNHPNHNHG